MQLALAAGSIDRDTAPDVSSTTRTNRLLAAGVALAGAGVIAVNPVAPVFSLDAHQSTVQLTSTTAENWENLMDMVAANPDPIGNALGELSSYYGEVASNSFEQTAAGIEGIWSGMGPVEGLETILPQITEFLQQGDFLGAWNLVNWDLLFNMNNVFQPLFDHTVRGTGEFVPGVFGLGGDMTRVIANVQDVFGDYSFWKGAAKSLTEPFLGYMFALTEGASPVEGHEAQDPMDALLNGYITWDSETGEETGQWWGLLTERGALAFLLETFPQKIADALTLDLPADDDTAGSAASGLADSVDTSSLDLSGLSDFSFDDILAGLFS